MAFKVATRYMDNLEKEYFIQTDLCTYVRKFCISLLLTVFFSAFAAGMISVFFLPTIFYFIYCFVNGFYMPEMIDIVFGTLFIWGPLVALIPYQFNKWYDSDNVSSFRTVVKTYLKDKNKFCHKVEIV